MSKSNPPADVEYKVGDKIIVKGRPGKRGQILWIGEPKGWGAVYYGVRLTEKRGDCDGEYKGVRKFRCEAGYGQYIQKKLIVELLPEDEGKDFDFLEETDKLDAKKAEAEEKYTENKDKLKELRQRFKDTDTDGSLSLDEAEFVKMALDVLKCTEDEAKKLFGEIDVSGNGSVSFAEFDSWLGDGGVEKLKTYAKLTEAFKNADTDGSLELDKAEFVKMAKESMDLDEKDAGELFTKIDTNGNGSICFAEFDAYVSDVGGLDNLKQYSELKKYFKEADTDDSNGLELKEFVKLAKDKLNMKTYKAKKLFAKVDTNKNGSIQFDEFEQYIDRIGGVKRLQKDDDAKEDGDEKKVDDAPKEDGGDADAGDADASKDDGGDADADADADAPKDDDAKDDDASKDYEAPKEDEPKEEPPKEEAPKEEPPKEEAPKEEPKKEAKKKDGKKKDAKKSDKKDTKKDAKKKDTKKDAKKTPAKKDAKKTPAKKDAKKKAPAKKEVKKDVKKDAKKKVPAKKEVKKDVKKKTPAKKEVKKDVKKKAPAKKDVKKDVKKDAKKKAPAKKDVKKKTGAKKDAKKKK